MGNSTPSAESVRYFFIAAFVVICAGLLKTLIMDHGWKPETD